MKPEKHMTVDTTNPDDSLLSLQEVCQILSISAATAKNWVRLGKLAAEEDGVHFDRAYINALSTQLLSGKDGRLQRRRNKKSLSGVSVYKNYIDHADNQKAVKEILSLGLSLNEQELRLVLANFSVQLYYQCRGLPLPQNAILLDFLKSHTAHPEFSSLIKDLTGKAAITDTDITRLSGILDQRMLFTASEDILGCIYISLRDIGQRKRQGAYYTPPKTVSCLIDRLCESVPLSGKSICDPCCGTGNFLIGLINRGLASEQLYGQDIDEISIQLARINVFLRCPDTKARLLCSHFTCRNTLTDTFSDTFDIVLGNPPWGFGFSQEELACLKLHYITARNNSAEAYDLFLEKSLSLLKNNGFLAFVLPEAVLRVASHAKIRTLLAQNCSFRFVSFLGNAFSGVQCPSVILGMRLDKKGSTLGCRVEDGAERFVIGQERISGSSGFVFDITDVEYKCLQTIASVPNAVYLKHNAAFALGIVTGDNQKYIQKNPGDGYEPILKGSDIYRYGMKKAAHYIRFSPEQFQQTAPASLYRAPEKLLYRFISEIPVFAYDDTQTLPLNSCNLLIPQIDGLEIKYVLAILNSSAAAYYLTQRFRSLKLLRSHLEQLPIPAAPLPVQTAIIEQTDRLMASREDIRGLYYELDAAIMELYHLSPAQQTIIQTALSGKNLLFKPAPSYS